MSWQSWLLTAILFVGIPFLAYANIEQEYSMRVLLQFSIIAAGVIATLVVIHRLKWASFITLPFILIISLYYLCLYILIGYYAVMNNYFDPEFLDFGVDVKNLVNLIGWTKTILAVAACSLVFLMILHMLRVQS